jgi:diguanylate cyclase (GGDEF)-like protein
MSAAWTDALVVEVLEREAVRLERLREEAERGRLAIRLALAGGALAAARGGMADIAPAIERAALREDLAALAQAQERILAQRAQIQPLEETIAALRADQMLDPLTGCLDREGFAGLVAREWSRAVRAGTPLGVVVVDVERSTELSARLGHPDGEALCAIARAIRGEARRPGEVVGRVGGDAFAIVVPDADLAGALALGERVRGTVTNLPLREGEVAVPRCMAVGVAAAAPTLAVQANELLCRAGRAASRAKAAGGAQAVALAVEGGGEVFYAPAQSTPPARSPQAPANSRSR